jgi:hypothetical protein
MLPLHPEPVARATRAGAAAIALMALTTVHHVYGAIVYATPWRHHVALPAGLAVLVIGASLAVLRRRPGTRAGRIAFWTAVAAIALFPVVFIGLFEGGYNHVLKDVLYFAGTPAVTMQRLFPPPTYEMPNDVFFEVTGVLQFVLGAVTAHLLYRSLRGTTRPHADRATPRASDRKASARRALADGMGLDVTALRLRLHRLRANLEACTRRCLEERRETSSPAAQSPSERKGAQR